LPIAERARRIGLSATLRISDLARRLRAEGRDVLDFSAGEPDFPTPLAIKRAGQQAIDQDRTRYTANAGVLELREALARRMHLDHGLDYTPDQILVSPGAKASLYFASQALFDPGDEVIVPLPYWVSYPEQVRLAQATPVFVPCREELGLKLDPQDLARAVTPRTKALLLNYPSNPTGACYRREELEPIAEVCVRHGLWIVADEIYARLVYDGFRFSSVAEIGPEVRARTIVVNGMSKTYSMTGWRIGYAAGPREAISAMAKIQSHSTSNATSISQWASLAALELDPQEIRRRVAEFQERRDVVVEGLRAIPGLSCRAPEGAFYVFPDVSGCLEAARPPLHGAEELARYLLEQAQVALVPGEAFGSSRHVRLSYAVPLERVREGVERMRHALAARSG
jgi:aspartate aminotransferase